MLERIGKVEFFSALLPGFYIFLAATIAFGETAVTPAAAGLWGRLKPLATEARQ